jgi:hypothetical protein
MEVRRGPQCDNYSREEAGAGHRRVHVIFHNKLTARFVSGLLEPNGMVRPSPNGLKWTKMENSNEDGIYSGPF